MAIVDFTNPEAAAWYTARLGTLLDMGVDYIKTDFGERIPLDAVYHNNADPLRMHNYYTYLYNKTVFEFLEGRKGPGKACLFARSATTGSQKFPVHWGGDCESTFEAMAETLRGGLSFMMSGFAFWSHDIGGFEATATPDLYKRWVQFGMFSTHSRLHGSKSYRVPWNFDEEACAVVRFFAELKCRLMPYLYRLAALAHETGVPVIRAMPLEFSGDPAVTHLDRQYMFGDRILVAPVFNAGGRAEFYLPDCGSGRWTHLLSGETREGGRWHSAVYDYFSLPLFVRPGTLLPVGGTAGRPDYDYTDGTEFRLYGLSDGASVRREITDLRGKTVLTVSVTRTGNELNARFTGRHKNCSVVVAGSNTKIAVEDNAGTLQIETGD
jgi:alpha-D-xyloside xylohydrolase